MPPMTLLRPGATTLRTVSPNKPPMRKRTFYASDKLWDAAKDAAAENKENIGEVIREALERYAKRGKK